MALNRGKEFEKLIQDSCSLQNIDCTRLKDAGYTGEQTTRRFTITNICDFIIFDGHTLLKLEAKHTQGKNIPLTRLKQLTRLITASQTTLGNVRQGFIMRFDDNIYYIHAEDLDKLVSTTTKKSLNEGEISANGLQVLEYVPKGKRNARIDIKEMMQLL